MSAMDEAGERELEAVRMLARLGIPATVRTSGHRREIAVISGSPLLWQQMSEAKRREAVSLTRALGYRYVALDLDPLDQIGE